MGVNKKYSMYASENVGIMNDLLMLYTYQCIATHLASYYISSVSDICITYFRGIWT